MVACHSDPYGRSLNRSLQHFLAILTEIIPLLGMLGNIRIFHHHNSLFKWRLKVFLPKVASVYDIKVLHHFFYADRGWASQNNAYLHLC